MSAILNIGQPMPVHNLLPSSSTPSDLYRHGLESITTISREIQLGVLYIGQRV